MASPTENNTRPSSEKTHLLKPCLASIDGFQAHQNRSAPSPPDLKFLTFSVSFNGWRFANKNFKSWARKMAALHEPIWRKAGIFEAVMASTYRIHQNTDLVLGIAEKWCPDTNTFVFPWGETTITLEDVMVLLGFSVLGSPVFATLDSSGEKIRAKLEKEWKKIREDKVKLVTQVIWMERFMDSGDELEHVAFLALWLCYFVFPSRFYYLSKAVFPIAVLLSCGTRIALAPAVLAHLYADLSLLKNHITTSNGSTKIAPSALFKLVQVWTWERFKELQPKSNPLLKGEPRLALWHDLKQRTRDARQILENSKIYSFEWRPYTKTVENWEFPQFYPEKGMWIPVSPSLDDVFLSFARCIKVSELVGTYSVEHYFPDRVASQFGMLQDVPCPANRKSLSQKEAWNDYNKPIDDLTLYIPSRSALPCVTPVFCEWWRMSFPVFKYSSEENLVVESAETFKERTIIDDDNSFVPSGSIMNSTSKDGMKIAEVLYKRSKYMKRAHENDEITMGCCQTQTPSDDDGVDDRLTIAQMVGPNKKKYSDVKNTSEPLGKKSRLEDNNDLGPCQKLASISDDGDETVPPLEIEQNNEASNETGSKEGKKVVSPPETRKTCDDELDVNESNADNNDGNKQPKYMKIAEHLTNKRRKYMKQARDKRLKYMKQARENGNNESAKTLKSRNSIGDDTSFVVSGSKMNRTSKDEMKIAEDLNKRSTYMKQARDERLKYMKQARDKRLNYMKQARKNGNNELAETLKSRNSIGDDDTSFVVSGSKVNRRSKDGIKIAEDLNKRRKYMKRARENDDSTSGRCQTQVHSDNDDSLSIAQFLILNKKYSDVKNSGRDFSKPLDKKSTLEAGNNDSGPFQKVASIRDDRDATLPPPEKDQRNEETDEIGSKAGKNMVESPFDENNSSKPPFDDIIVSPPETRQTCDDELDVYGNNAEKKTMVNDGSKKPDCLLHKDGIIAGEKASSNEKLCSSEAEKEDDVFVNDDSLTQKKLSLEELALKADNNEPSPHQKLASGETNGDETSRAYKSKVLSPSDESNIHIAVGEGSQGHDCLLHENALASEETMKFNEQIEDSEKRNNNFGVGDVDNDYNEKRFQDLKVLASSIEERILKAERTVAWLIERRAIKQRKLAAARRV